jgi:hypothetical protein
MIEALEETDGLVYLTAQKLGCSPMTIYLRAKVDPEVQAAIDNARGRLIDLAENSLKDAVENGEGWAVCFTLKTLGRHRGYIERLELALRTQRDRIEASIERIMSESACTREEAIEALASQLEGAADIKGLIS